MITGACWRCEQPGHAWADCNRQPAATRRELQARITHVTRWQAGEIGLAMKRRFVQTETAQYEKGKAK